MSSTLCERIDQCALAAYLDALANPTVPFCRVWFWPT